MDSLFRLRSVLVDCASSSVMYGMFLRCLPGLMLIVFRGQDFSNLALMMSVSRIHFLWVSLSL